MKTAVEWLMDILITENEITLKGENYKLFEIAKEMEKQQIIEAHGNKQKTKSAPDSIVTYGYTFTGEAYYNKTYKKTEQ